MNMLHSVPVRTRTLAKMPNVDTVCARRNSVRRPAVKCNSTPTADEIQL